MPHRAKFTVLIKPKSHLLVPFSLDNPKVMWVLFLNSSSFQEMQLPSDSQQVLLCVQVTYLESVFFYQY